jgi:competence protein ComEC
MRLHHLICLWLTMLPLLAGSAPCRAASADQRNLKIVFVDVEGGAATLIVTPMGESVLIDTGWEREDERDAKRMEEAARKSGVRRIDHLIITHWHRDHFGGTQQLAKRIPIGRFYDRGIPEQFADDPEQFPRLIAGYREAGGGRSITLKQGDEIPLRQDTSGRLPRIRLRCLVSNAKVIDESRHAAADGCDAHPAKPEDSSDNARSIGVRLDYGDFSMWAGGDLTWNVEHRLACPVNRVGAVSLYLTDHHGLNSSNNPALVHALQPRVAVMNCGASKGGDIESTRTLRSSPGLQAIYQVHRAVRYGAEGNAPPDMIANHDAACQGLPVVAEVTPDGASFEVRAGWDGRPRRFVSRPASRRPETRIGG